MARGLFWPMLQAFTYDETTYPIHLNSYGPKGGWVLGTCPHMYHPQCIIPFMVQRRHCVLCWTPFHNRLYAMFNLKHCMPLHWEYNAQNAPNYKKKWGTNLVWKWRHGLRVLDFVASFVNLKKTLPWWIQLAMSCTQTQMMDIKIYFAKL